MRYFAIPNFLIALLLISCGTSSPQDLAKSHLELLQSNKNSEANQQYCIQKESLRLQAIKGFEIINSQSKVRDGSSFTEVVSKIDTNQTVLKNVEANGVTVPRPQSIQQVSLEIWKSNDFYNNYVAETANINNLAQKTEALTGIKQKTSPVPNRTEVNKAHLCVFLPFDQFENDTL